MSSFSPDTKHFIGADKCLKGTDWIRTHQFLDSTGATINMADYDPANGGSARMTVKSEDLATTYFDSQLGTIALDWTDSATIRIRIGHGYSSAISGTIPNSAIYQLEGTSGSTGYTDRILQGRFEMDFEVAS